MNYKTIKDLSMALRSFANQRVLIDYFEKTFEGVLRYYPGGSAGGACVSTRYELEGAKDFPIINMSNEEICMGISNIQLYKDTVFNESLMNNKQIIKQLEEKLEAISASIEDAIEQQEELREEVQQLRESNTKKEGIVETKKIKKCEKGKWYYFTNYDFAVYETTESNSLKDDLSWETGNYYPQSQFTKGEIQKTADEKLAYQKALTKVNRWIEEKNRGWVADYANNLEQKCWPCYNHPEKLFEIAVGHYTQHSTAIFPLMARQYVRELIKELEPELRVIFGVK